MGQTAFVFNVLILKFFSEGIAVFEKLCYIKAMKKNDAAQLPFAYTLWDIRLNVFKTGRSLRLKNELRSARDPDSLNGIHSHFTYEVFFVTEGALELVTDRETTVYERKIVIIPPKLRHYSFVKKEGSFCLLFSLEKVQAEQEPRARALKDLLDSGICQLDLEEDLAFYIAQAAKKLEEGTEDAGREAKLLIELLFTRIVAALLPSEKSPCVAENPSDHINAIEQYINSHLARRITLGDIAAHVYLSTRQVSRIIAKEWGCSLVELVTEKKLARAEIMLKKTDMKIADIATHVNVGSVNYFYTLFKNRYGMSPLQYRKHSR